MPALTACLSLVRRSLAWLARSELVLLGAAAPFLLFPGRWTALVFLLIPLAWLCRWVAYGRPSVRTRMDFPLALLVAMAVAGYAISIDREMSRAKVWGIVLQVAVFYGVTNSLRRERHLLAGAGVLCGLTAAVAVLSLVGTDWGTVRLIDLPWLYERLPRLVRDLPGSGLPQTSEFFNPREVGGTLAMLLPVPFGLLFFGQQRWLRLLAGLAVATAGLVLLLTQSLQAFLGLGLGLFLIAVWRSRWFLLLLPAGLVALTVGVLAYGPGRAALALLSPQSPLGIGVVLRLDIWSRALAMVRDMPFTGIGLNTFPLVQTGFYPGLLLGPEPHTHNVFLQAAVDLGLPGLVALVWLLVAFYRTVLRAYRASASPELQALLVGAAGAVLAYLGFGLVDVITLGAKPMAALFAIMGAVPAVERLSTPACVVRPRLQARRLAVAAAGLSLVAAVALAVTVAPAYWWMDLGRIQAHRAILDARRTGVAEQAALRSSLETLQRALGRQPDNPYAWDLLGTLYAWQGDDRMALEAFGRRAVLDMADPMGRYAPFVVLRRQVAGEKSPEPWRDLLQVYTYWRDRFPDRSEGYVRMALVWERYGHDVGQATGVLQTGAKRGAQPAGLLSFFLERLGE